MGDAQAEKRRKVGNDPLHKLALIISQKYNRHLASFPVEDSSAADDDGDSEHFDETEGDDSDSEKEEVQTVPELSVEQEAVLQAKQQELEKAKVRVSTLKSELEQEEVRVSIIEGEIAELKSSAKLSAGMDAIKQVVRAILEAGADRALTNEDEHRPDSKDFL